jgi:hypothetical protein
MGDPLRRSEKLTAETFEYDPPTLLKSGTAEAKTHTYYFFKILR